MKAAIVSKTSRLQQYIPDWQLVTSESKTLYGTRHRARHEKSNIWMGLSWQNLPERGIPQHCVTSLSFSDHRKECGNQFRRMNHIAGQCRHVVFSFSRDLKLKTASVCFISTWMGFLMWIIHFSALPGADFRNLVSSTPYLTWVPNRRAVLRRASWISFVLNAKEFRVYVAPDTKTWLQGRWDHLMSEERGSEYWL